MRLSAWSKAALVAVGFFCGTLLTAMDAWAIPSLQVYIPNGQYVGGSEESWVTNQSEFELWVIAAQNDVADVYLTMSVLSEASGSITLTELASGREFVYIPVAGINPGYTGQFSGIYAEHSIGDMLVGVDDVYDMTDPDAESAQDGLILKYNVAVSSYGTVYFNARGDGEKKNAKAVTFAPNSHDGKYSAVPEPLSLSLLGLGVAGLVGWRRKQA